MKHREGRTSVENRGCIIEMARRRRSRNSIKSIGHSDKALKLMEIFALLERCQISFTKEKQRTGMINFRGFFCPQLIRKSKLLFLTNLNHQTQEMDIVLLVFFVIGTPLHDRFRVSNERHVCRTIFVNT